MERNEPNVLSRVSHYIVLFIGYSASAIYGLYFIFMLIKRWITDPSVKFWKVKPRELPPKVLNDPALGNHAYVQIKNVKLHYVERGDRSKPLMLFLHGYPEFWYSWRHQIKEFSDDYWVVAVDMRGYGDSEKLVGKEHYTIPHLVEDVKNLIIALGCEKCTLVAHDWGGIIAWFFVLLEPQMIDSYVIMNSAHPIAFRNVINKSFSQMMKSWYVFFYQLPYLPELMCRIDDMGLFETILKPKEGRSTAVTDEDIEAYKFTFGKSGAFTFPINYYRANFMLEHRSSVQNRGKSADFPPGLILNGEKDDYIEKEIQEQSLKLVENATLVYVKGASHFVQQDDPISVNKEMRVFLKRIKAKTIA